VKKDFIIDFDMNFNLMEEESFKDNERAKDIPHLMTSVDSLGEYYDSVGRAFYNDMRCSSLFFSNTTQARRRNFETGGIDNITPPNVKHIENDTIVIDSIYNRMEPSVKQRVIYAAMQKTNIMLNESQYRTDVMEYGSYKIRRHWMAFWQKFSMALSCLLFFFIGAPLGAIIRKGGLGLPVVISVIIFIMYYIVDNTCMKMGRDGVWPVWIGMWVSSMVMAPLGVFFTVKSNNDSVVFNRDSYVNFLRKLWGIRPKRHIGMKEVIINDPDYGIIAGILDNIVHECRDYRGKHRLFNLKEALGIIFSRRRDEQIVKIDNAVEYVVDALSNSRDRKILIELNKMPVLDIYSFRFYRRRRRDLKLVMNVCQHLKHRCEELDPDMINN